MLTVRDAIPKVQELATAEFATLHLRLLKIVETTSRIRLAFAGPAGRAPPFAQPTLQAGCKVRVIRR